MVYRTVAQVLLSYRVSLTAPLRRRYSFCMSSDFVRVLEPEVLNDELPFIYSHDSHLDLALTLRDQRQVVYCLKLGDIPACDYPAD